MAATEDALIIGQAEAGRVLRVPFGAASLDEATELLVDAAGRDQLGLSVISQDVNGDGVLDLWVGAPRAALGAGQVTLLVGPDFSEAYRFDAHLPAGRLGERLWACPDLDGDAVPDVIAASPWLEGALIAGAAPAGALAGAVVLISGAVALAGGDAVGPPLYETRAGAVAGQAVLCGADLAGDGEGWLVVGAPFHGGSAGGRLYVVPQAALAEGGELERVAQAVVDGPKGAWLGASLALLSSAGGAEVAVGVPGASSGAGGVWFFRAPDLLESGSKPILRVAGLSPLGTSAHVGRWLSAGSFDADPYTDLLVGAPDFRTGDNGYDAGAAWILGSEGRLGWGDRGRGLDGAGVKVQGGQPFGRVGRAPLLVDVDGDGRDALWLPLRAATP